MTTTDMQATFDAYYAENWPLCKASIEKGTASEEITDEREALWDTWQDAWKAALAFCPDAQPKVGAMGWKLAMRVMQSDLFDKLDDDERAECDALVRANPYLGRSSTAAAQVDERGAWNIDSRESRSAFRNYDSIAEPVSGKTPWQIWRDACAWQARAAAPQAEAAQGVPEGWKLMPPSLTQSMRMAMGTAAAEYMKRTGGNSLDVIYEAGFAAAPDREQVGEACIAPACHQWDGTDRCTCQRHRTLDTLKRVATALPVLRTMLATEGLGGVEVADEMLSDIRALLGEKADASPSRECGEQQSFPERDPSKTNAEQGLYRKFEVRRVDGSDATGGKHDGCEYFVLDMTHDAHAPAALRAYAQACASTHPHLSADLMVRFGGERQGAALSEASVRQIAHRFGVLYDDRVTFYGDTLTDFIRAILAASAPTLGEQPQAAEPKGLYFKRSPFRGGWTTFNIRDEDADEAERRLLANGE